jgi:hypothetical protein
VAEDRDQWWALVNMVMNLWIQEMQDIPLLSKRILACQEELHCMKLLFGCDFISCKEGNLYKTTVIHVHFKHAQWM